MTCTSTGCTHPVFAETRFCLVCLKLWLALNPLTLTGRERTVAICN